MDVNPLISEKAKLVLSVSLTRNVPKFTEFTPLGDLFVSSKFDLESNVFNVSAKVVDISPADQYHLIKIEDSTGQGLLCLKNSIAKKLEVIYTYLDCPYLLVSLYEIYIGRQPNSIKGCKRLRNR